MGSACFRCYGQRKRDWSDVIHAFVKMRGELAANAAILKRLAEIDKTLLIHDVALREIFEKLRPLLAPPPAPPKPEIGFHVKEDAVPYTAPISEQRPKVATNGRGSGFCRALPGENMTISIALKNPWLLFGFPYRGWGGQAFESQV